MDTITVNINVLDVNGSGIDLQIYTPKPFRCGANDIICDYYLEPVYDSDRPFITLWLNPDMLLTLNLTEKEFKVLLDRFKKYDKLNVVVNGWKRERYTL